LHKYHLLGLNEIINVAVYALQIFIKSPMFYAQGSFMKVFMDHKSAGKKVQELVIGVHPIIELLKAKRRKLYTIYTTKPAPKAWDLVAPLLTKDIQIQFVARDILTRIAGTADHQGIVAWASPFIFRKKFFDPVKSPFLVMLDSIQDPRNLGAILRSAYCTGVNGVILTSKSSAPLSAIALKSSAGLAEHLEIYEAQSAASAMQELKKHGYTIYLAALGGQDATAITFQKTLCLVIGNEAVGISKNLFTFGTTIQLPQRTSDISYNASVAAGILLFLIAHDQGRI
jgi:23S rRNA (guanosine2251-2'-O)-methyltransferase